jgi:hypothetical protein
MDALTPWMDFTASAPARRPVDGSGLGVALLGLILVYLVAWIFERHRQNEYWRLNPRRERPLNPRFAGTRACSTTSHG